MEFPKMCPARLLSDQHFGMSMPPHDYLYQFYDMHSNYFRPWKYGQDISKEFGSTIENEKGNFKITLDVQYYRPNEINVKVANNEIIVEGKHEERPDTHGFVTRQFKRRYPLPSQCPPENVTSTLTSDGVLTIIAEKKMTKEVEKIVPIKMCGVCPLKNQIETKFTSEITQNMQKENIKNTEDLVSNNNVCPIFKQDLMKEAISETNGTCTKMEATKASTEVSKTERTDPLNISSTTNKIEESIGKSILGLTALTEQLGHSSVTSTSETSGIKTASELTDIKNITVTTDTKCTPEMCQSMSEKSGVKSASEVTDIKNAAGISGMKSTSETTGMKSTSQMTGMKSEAEMSGMKSMSEMKSSSEISGIKNASEKVTSGMTGIKNTSEMAGIKNATEMMSGMERVKEIAGMKCALEMSDMKSALDACGMKSLDTCGMKGLSKMLMEESSSTYKSSSSMSSSTRISGKTGETISDITAELREAAENV